MDTNYLLGREQISLHNAAIAASSPARIAHEGLAAAYSAVLAERGFPHRNRPDGASAGPNDDGTPAWDNEGGAVPLAPARGASNVPGPLPPDPEPMHGTQGHVVITPDGPQPYKVVLEHEKGRDTEQPVGSVREGEQLIGEETPRPLARETLFDRPPASG